MHAGQEAISITNGSPVNFIRLQLDSGRITIHYGNHISHVSRVTFSSRGNSSVNFVLTIPGKITRRYDGQLEVKMISEALEPIVNMDLETAVASVVAAEGISTMPLEALKAQAIATRSYFIAGKGRHEDFDFCDTTHCQFLRQPPGPETLAYKATMATRGLVLAYNSSVFTAMYTRSCSGHTLKPSDVGLPSGAYPYYSVDCKYCQQHPDRWSSRISPSDASALRRLNESSRLALDRRLGWKTVQSDSFTMAKKNGTVLVEGIGQGHGIGLCQAGAQAMAQEGADFREILAHYYPNTTIVDRQRAQ